MVCDLVDIKQLRTTSLHPQADGQSERMIRTAKIMIRCIVNDNQENWHLGLNQLMFAYNSSVNQATKQIQFMMVYGRATRISIYVIYGFEKEYETGVLQTNFDFNVEQVLVLPNIGEETANVPIEAKRYLKSLEEKFEKAYNKRKKKIVIHSWIKPKWITTEKFGNLSIKWEIEFW